MTGPFLTVTVAFATGADVKSWHVAASSDERELIERDLAWLFKLGHIAGYSAQPAEQPVSAIAWRGAVNARIGSLIMDAIKGCALRIPEPPADMLVPVFPFELNGDGMLVSTARFQGIDVEITAMPSIDEETGFRVPGQAGTFLPVITPYPAWRASSVI